MVSPSVEAWENPTEGCKVSSVGANTNTTSFSHQLQITIYIPSKLPRQQRLFHLIYFLQSVVGDRRKWLHDGNSVLWRTICALLDAMQDRECCVHGHRHGMTHSIDNPLCQAATHIVSSECVVKFAREICYFRTIRWNLIFYWFLARMFFYRTLRKICVLFPHMQLVLHFCPGTITISRELRRYGIQ